MRHAALAALLLAIAACSTGPAEPPAAAAAAATETYDLAAQRAKIARVPMAPDTSFLNAEEREVVNLLVPAAELMNPIYLRQRPVENPTMPAAEREQALATYFVGIFRAVRFGTDEAHGRGAALQYSYFKEKGAFGWDERARRFGVDYAKLESGIRGLVAEPVRLQGNGDYAGTKAFFDRYARLDERARAVLATTAHIPTDIQRVYPERV